MFGSIASNVLAVVFVCYEFSIAVSDMSQLKCPNTKYQHFRINLDPNGLGKCAVEPAPSMSIAQTEHQGECIEACATKSDCLSYNYHHDTSECELFCIPSNYSTVDGCYNYVVS